MKSSNIDFETNNLKAREVKEMWELAYLPNAFQIRQRMGGISRPLWRKVVADPDFPEPKIGKRNENGNITKGSRWSKNDIDNFLEKKGFN